MTSPSRDRRVASVTPPRLSEDEIDELFSMRLIANLASVDRAGTIHVVPIWFRRVRDLILMPTSRYTRKYRNLKRHPAASVMIDVSRSGLDLRGVLVRGSVRIVEAPEALELNRSIHLRYVTEDGLEQPEVRNYLTEGDDITLALAIDELVSWNHTSSPAGMALRTTRNHVPLDL